MHLKSAAIFFLVSATLLVPALAKPRAEPESGLFKGTPQEQAACSPDATRFCSDAIPDTFRVLACLQEHRHRLRKACRQVLENHGE